MGILYVVATPIGNLDDITLRALSVLKDAKIVFAEDTRISKKLFNLLTIDTKNKKFVSLHHHTDVNKFEKFVKEIETVGNAILITDAGTPNISDPGGMFVRYIADHAKSISIVPIPGPSALTALLSVAGMNVQEFVFKGFIPHKKGRQTFLKEVAVAHVPIVFFESCHRITKLLDEYEKILMETKGTNSYIVVGRELTKKFENIYRGSVGGVRKQVYDDPIKGEYVIVIGR